MTGYVTAFFTSLLVSGISMPLIIKLSLKLNIFDHPNQRKIHPKPISNIGGLGIFVAFFISFLLFFCLKRFEFPSTINIPLYITAFSLSFILGFLDDIFHIRARYKLIAQIIIAFIASLSGLLIVQFSFFNLITIKFGYFSYFLSIIWIIMFMNAINLIDGMDGLASGILILASIFIFSISIIIKNDFVSFLSIVLFGSIAGFYIFNFPPAKIFMGDGGAYFLGFIFSTFGLMGIKKSSIAVLLIIPLILLMIPILDILQVIFRRIKEQKNIFIADKSHIHHRLLSIGFSTRSILFITYMITIILGVFSVLIVLLPKEYAFLIFVLIFLIMFFSFYMIYLFEKQVLKKNNKK